MLEDLLTFFRMSGEFGRACKDGFLLANAGAYLKRLDKLTIYEGMNDEEGRTRSAVVPKIVLGSYYDRQRYAILLLDERPALTIRSCAYEPGRYWLQLVIATFPFFSKEGLLQSGLALNAAGRLAGVVNQFAERGHGLLLKPYLDGYEGIDVIYCTQISQKILRSEFRLKETIRGMQVEAVEKFIPAFNEGTKDILAREAEFNCSPAFD